jgi:Cu/Ag efflux protein CusF
MFTRNVLSVFSLLVLTACAAAYKLEPLMPQHPAHPEATAAPEPLPSATLSYGASDIPSPMPASALYAAQKHPGMQEARAAEGGQKTVEGEGKVIAVVPSSSQVVVEHGEIQGFMEAMTMGYRADPPSLLEGLEAGDRIRFTIDIQNKSIVKIMRLRK